MRAFEPPEHSTDDINSRSRIPPGMLLATFRFDHDALALAETFEQVPELDVEAERIAAHATEWTMPCLWATNTADT